MKNTFGSSVSVTLFGESHGKVIGAVVDGIAPGIPIEEDYIKRKLSMRSPSGIGSTARREPDDFDFVSGVFHGKTTGAPLTVLIRNLDARGGDYEETRFLPRPSHADYTAFIKYHGYEDTTGGGHFSGRLTAALVAAGAVVLFALEQKGILIGTHMKRCGGISDRDFSDLSAELRSLDGESFPVLDGQAKDQMQNAVEQAAKSGDSVGGILETAITGLPAGLGEPWFDSFESVLSRGVFGIPAVKGIAFGDGFALSDKRGSEANDAFAFDENGGLRTLTNHGGGISGGITNAMPVLFSTVVKPTPTIALPQRTVDLSSGENTVRAFGGRHDACIVPRAAVVQSAVSAFAVADLLALRYGTDHLGK